MGTGGKHNQQKPKKQTIDDISDIAVLADLKSNSVSRGKK